MKRKFRFAALRPGKDARLPALLAALLLVLLVTQAMLPDTIALPPAGVVGRGDGGDVTPPPAVVIPPAIVARQMFAPGAGPATGAPGTAPPDPLDGLAVAGSVRIGRVAYAIVQPSGGRAVRVAVGGSVAGWRLAGLTGEGAIFTRGARRVVRAFGATPATVAPADTEEEQ